MVLDVLDISVVDAGLAIALLLLFIYQAYFYIRYIRVPKVRKTTDDKKPGVSVVVCARNEGYNLKSYVQSLLTQDYPLYEVIIVNDGSEDNTQDIIDEYMVLDQRVRTTFVPKGARVRSTKKLGLTLAAKASQYEYLLLTDADCRPESPHWIAEMMSGFAKEGTEVVLGYGAYFEEDTLLNNLIQYDTLFNGAHYLAAASTGHPYMGVGRNLAYRKEMFFAHGGFSELMTERAGDDDLFVNKVATKANTQVVCTRDSITWSEPKNTWKHWFQQKRRHVSVSPAYNMRSKLHLIKEPITRALFYTLFAVVLVVGGPFVVCVASIAFFLRLLLQLVIINCSARRLGQVRFGMEIIWYDIFLPIVMGIMMLLPKQKNTW